MAATSTKAQSSSSRPAGPRPLPVFGHSLSFSRDPLNFLTGVARDYGDVAFLRLGGNDVYFVSHPDLVREVLTVQRAKFDLSAMRSRLELFLGLGLVTSRGDLHTQQRRLMQPVFRKSNLDTYAPAILECAERQYARWQPGAEIDVTEEMVGLSLRVAARAMFDAEVESDLGLRHATTVLEFFSSMMSPFLYLSLKLPLPSTLRFRRAQRSFDAAVYRMIEERRARPSARADLLGLLMQAKDDGTNAYMSERQLRDEIVTLLSAGHETVANTLSWALYLLSLNPAWQDALHTEALEVLAGRPRFEAADAGKLRVTRQVLLETLRLYPPIWFAGRRAQEDVQLGAHVVPKGTNVLLSQYVVHRDPRWFEAPDTFRPERWTEAFMKGLPFGAYFPFGAGERHCIGEGFAWLEATLILATLFARWRFEHVPGQDVRPKPSITLVPSSIRARAVPRQA